MSPSRSSAAPRDSASFAGCRRPPRSPAAQAPAAPAAPAGTGATGGVPFCARRTDLFAGVGVGLERCADAAASPRDEELAPFPPLGDVLRDPPARALHSIGRGQRAAVTVRAGEVNTTAQQPRPRN